MELTTRCPQCGTTFSATLQQLQLRKGFIRCINCAHIFDGYEAVVETDKSSTPAEPELMVPAARPPVAPPLIIPARSASEAPVRPAPAARHAEDVGTGRFTISATAGAQAPDSRQDPVFKIGASDPEHGAKEPSVGPVVAASTATDPRIGGGSIYIEPRRRAPASAPGPERDEFLEGHAAGSSSLARVFWGVLILSGLLLLAGQALYVYRAQIANQVPALRPMLEQACVSLACKVPYSRRIDQISVTSSALRATPTRPGGSAPEAESRMTLQFTLRNAYDKPQEWPTMVLDLKDFSGTLVVRKNLTPTEYLAPDTLSRPFPASSELTVSLPIKLDGLKVNGYQLDKFFQ
ncbi:DUF3426 domain-containing protein [Alcaligenaceae bacterium]|nr:DUF3426 domain-containing protein [Alcaligenaceae bacterium]